MLRSLTSQSWITLILFCYHHLQTLKKMFNCIDISAQLSSAGKIIGDTPKLYLYLYRYFYYTTRKLSGVKSSNKREIQKHLKPIGQNQAAVKKRRRIWRTRLKRIYIKSQVFNYATLLVLKYSERLVWHQQRVTIDKEKKNTQNTHSRFS